MKTIALLKTRCSDMRCGRSMLVGSALALAALVLPIAAEPAATLRETLARGLVAEEVNRDLESARRDYEAVLAEFTDQRAVAASALFRLAEIHRAQGRKDEAVTHYQRLLREFPDADREKDLARRQLAEWQIAPAADGPAMAAIDDEEAALQRLKLLRQRSPDVFRQAENELQDAIDKGWMRQLNYLLEEGHDSDRALVIASDSGNLEAVKLILALPDKPSARAAFDAIYAAVDEEHDEVLRTLLAAGLDLNYQPDPTEGKLHGHHGTLLHYLMSPDLLPQLRILIDAGADVNAASNLTGHSPLHVALTWRQSKPDNLTELIKLLLDKGADVNARIIPPDQNDITDNPEAGLSVLDITLEANRPEFVAMLLERGADAKQEGLLAKACSMENGLVTARLLLDRGADPNTPAEHPPIIRAFQNVDSNGSSNEKLASHRHQIALIRLLLDRGADPNTIHGTFRRNGFTSSDLGYTDFGIGLFTLHAENSIELPAGLFHQVMKLHAQHNILNLELVKDLLDAGAVPKGEFPEIFAFVATHGKSAMSASAPRLGGNIKMEEGDGNPTEIARALLAHRPAKVFPENLRWAKGWDPGVRRVVLDEVIYPPLAANGITLSYVADGTLQPLVAPNDTIPDTAAFLFKNIDSLHHSTLTRVRRGPDNTWQRTAIDWQATDKLPDLIPGDILEMEGEEANAELLRWSLQKRLPAFPVTFEIDGHEREITIRPDLLAFDPAGNEAPLLEAFSLANLLGKGQRPDGTPEAFLAGATLTLHREGWQELKLAMHLRDKPLPLEAGDRLVVERGQPFTNLMPIALLIPGTPFVKVFDAEDPPTLIQAIADAWSPWGALDANTPVPKNDEASLAWRAAKQAEESGDIHVSVVPRDPDFSKIRIRRNPQGGEESVLSIDLEKAIRECTDETTPIQARLADIQLQRGDIIEIPLRENLGKTPWKGFSQETIRFFDKVLSARYVVIDSVDGVQPREFRYQAPHWIDGPHGLIALPPEDGSPSANYSAIARGRSYQIQQLLRDGGNVPLDSTIHWFVRDGDQATLQRVNPPQAPPRPRTVSPPPPNGR